MADKIKAVVFDLYGTLVEIRNKTHVYHRLIEKSANAEELGHLVLTKMISFAQLAQMISPDRKIDFRAYQLDLLKELGSVVPYPETFDVLERLRGRFPLGLISNVAMPYVKAFSDLGLDRFMNRLDCSFSCECGMKKPEKQIYQVTAQIMRVAPQEILMVGDSIECDVLGPRTAEMNSVLLDRTGKLDFPEKISSLEGIFDYIAI